MVFAADAGGIPRVAPSVLAAVLLLFPASGGMADQQPERFSTLVSRGFEALEAEDYSRAVEVLFRAVELRPDDADARYYLAKAYSGRQNYRKATLHLDKVLEIAPGHSRALVELAYIAEINGRFELADRYYSRALESGPDRRVERLRAALMARRGRHGEAIATLSRLVEQEPEDTKARYQLGLALMGSNDLGAAARELRRVADDDPDHLGALMNLANCLGRLGREQEAEAVRERFVEASRRARAHGQSERRTYFLLMDGLAALNESRHEDAAAIYREVLEIDPSNVAARYNLAISLAALGHGEEAIRQYRDVIDRDPQHLLARNNLGNLLSAAGRLNEAVAQFEEVIRLEPDDATAHNNLGLAYARLGDSQLAVDQFQRALSIRPDYLLARLNLGMALGRRGNRREAIDQLTRAVQLDPAHAHARYQLGLALMRDGRLVDAVDQLSEAVRLDASLLPSVGRIARILATHNDGARRDGPQAIRLADTLCQQTRYSEPRALDTLAAAYAEARRFDEATRTARRALELARSSGDDGLARQIDHRLELYASGRPYREPGGGSD